MGTSLHVDIANIAQSSPAIQIGERLLTDLLTRRLRDALDRFIGQYQRYPTDAGVVQIGIASCTYNPAAAGWAVTVPTVVDGAAAGVFFIETANAFEVNFVVTKYGDTTIKLFTVVLRITGIKALGTAGYNVLSLRDVDISYTAMPERDNDVVKNAAEIGLLEIDLARLEGLIVGSIAPTTIKSIFNGAPPINLHSLFPAVNFQGQAELAVVQGGLLIVAKNGWRLDETQRCPCGATAPAVKLVPQTSIEGTDGGTIDITVIVPPHRTPPWPVEHPITPEIALYLPEPTVKEITGGPYPAITGFVEDNGFIGWSFDYTVGFANAGISLTDPRATILLNLDFFVSGAGQVNVDLPCVGRTAAGLVWVTNRQNGASRVEIGVTPRLQPDGKVVLIPELLSLDIKPFKVDVIVIAFTALSFFGPWGTFAGFVLNEIVRAVIAFSLPIQLKSGLRDAMGKQMWTLLDLSKFDISRIFSGNYQARAAVSRDLTSSSLLVGLAQDG